MPAREGARMHFRHYLDSGGGSLFAVRPAWEDNSDRDDARPSVAGRSFAEADRVVEGLRDRLVGSRGIRAANVPDSGRTFREKLLAVFAEELDKTLPGVAEATDWFGPDEFAVFPPKLLQQRRRGLPLSRASTCRHA